MGILFTTLMGFLLTITIGIQFTISNSSQEEFFQWIPIDDRVVLHYQS